MVFSALQASILLYLFAASPYHGQAVDATISCETAARRLGQPLDGWKAIVDRSKNNHYESCVREAVDLQCAPLGTQFYHPETRIAECCLATGSITWQDEEAKLGFCCASGHEWTGDISSGEGGCCLTGMLMVDGRCVHKPEEEAMAEGGGCGCSSKHTPPSAPSSGPSIELGHSAPRKSEEPESGGAGDDPLDLMGVAIDLDIRYGHCYRLSLQDGREVGSNRENAVYTPQGLFPNIPFRICRSTSNCSEGQMGTVSSQSQFFLQDQVGRHNDPTGTIGWVTRNDRGTLKMMFTPDVEKATGFTGRRSKACTEEANCGLKLNGVPLEILFRETTCMVVEPEMVHKARHSSDEL